MGHRARATGAPGPKAAACGFYPDPGYDYRRPLSGDRYEPIATRPLGAPISGGVQGRVVIPPAKCRNLRLMPLLFPVLPGTILLCDYTRGFRLPEMVKRRSVIVISPRLPHRDYLWAVVPLSTTAPARDVAYVCRLELARPLPPPFDAAVCWAKADMVATVGFERLDLFRTGRDRTGRRQYLHPRLSDADLTRVRAAVLHGLGLGSLTGSVRPDL